MRIRIQGFYEQKLEKNLKLKKMGYFIDKLQFSHRVGRVLSFFSSRRNWDSLSTSKNESSLLFSIFVDNLCPPGSGSAFNMRIRIQQLKLMRIRIHNPGAFIYIFKKIEYQVFLN
jgi:hypothetical protein